MSFAHYSIPREYGEPVPESEDGYKYPQYQSISDKSQPISKQREVVEIPKEFDNAFYIEGKTKRDGYFKDTREYWEWERLRRYSCAVYELYKACVKNLNAKYNFEIPKWAKSNSATKVVEIAELDSLADKLRDAENKLVDRFNKSGKSLPKKIYSSKTLINLQNYGALAWMFYNILNNKIDLKSHKKTKTIIKERLETNKDFDILVVLNIATLYSVKMENQFTVDYLGKDFSNQNYYIARGLYVDKDGQYIDLKKIVSGVFNQVDACTYDDYKNVLGQIENRLNEISKDEINKSLIKFLKMRQEILILCNKIKYVCKKYGNYPNIFIDNRLDGTSVDMVKQANIYCKACERLYNNLTNDYFKREVNKVWETLTETIEIAYPIYKKGQQYD